MRAGPLKTHPPMSLHRRRPLRLLGTYFAIAAGAASPNGTLRKNTQCQDAYVVMKPPTVGPTTGATIAGHAIVEMAFISRLFSVLRTTVIRPPGPTIAP